MRYDTLRPGPDLALQRPELEEPQTELLEPPSVIERRLRQKLGEMVAMHAVEDDAGWAGARISTGLELYYRYNAALKQVTGNKNRAQISLAELEAAIGWLGRNGLADQLHLLDNDPRYAWTARRLGEWTPPVGR